MKDASGFALARCQKCNRPVRVINMRIGRNGLRVGPGCFKKMLIQETDSRVVMSS